MDDLDELTVCVTTYNEENNIEQCIDGILANGVKNIMIVDASKDRTADLARAKGVVVYSIDEENRGRVVQKVYAVSKCKTKYLAFVDADDVLDKKCLSTLLQEMKKNGWDAIQAHGRAFHPKSYWEKGMDALCHYILSKPGSTKMVGRPCVHTTESLRAIGGGGDIRFNGHDDTTISIKLENTGYKQGIGSGITYRKHPATFEECKEHWVRYGLQDAQLIKYYPEKKRNVYFHLLVEYPIIRSLKLLIHGQALYIPYTVLCGLVRFYSMAKNLRKLKRSAI